MKIRLAEKIFHSASIFGNWDSNYQPYSIPQQQKALKTLKIPMSVRGALLECGVFVFGDLIHGVGSKHGRVYILPIANIYPKGCNDLDGWEVIPETIGQFTGLLDKNGKEIYEGDILGFERERNFTKEVIHLFEVRWENYGNGMIGWTQFSPIDQIVKVGNIYDDPELI